MSALGHNQKKGICIGSHLFLHIKSLRERRPPYILSNVEPTVGHQVLTDRVHITDLGSRINAGTLVPNHPLPTPIFREISVFGWYRQWFSPRRVPTGRHHRTNRCGTVELNGEITKCNTWARVVLVRVRPTEGVCASHIENRINPSVLPPI